MVSGAPGTGNREERGAGLGRRLERRGGPGSSLPRRQEWRARCPARCSGRCPGRCPVVGRCLRPFSSLPLAAAPVLTEDGAEPPHAGGAEERGDLQRAPGELRQLDEHQPAGGYLHITGRGQVLADARVLHPRQHHQIPADPRRDHRHGQGGGGVQGQGPWGHAAAEAAEGPWRGRSWTRCVWWPWPRHPGQWKRPAGEEARQAISQAVMARDTLGFVTSGLPPVQKRSLSHSSLRARAQIMFLWVPSPGVFSSL